jgi:hypothetical protein
MSYFADLTPYTYHDADELPGPACNVGWLDPDQPFDKGPVSEEFLASLARRCAAIAFATRGLFPCAIAPCEPTMKWPPPTVTVDGKEIYLGDAEVVVGFDGGKWFVAPNLVYHYIAAHDYRPPDEFIEAVLRGRSWSDFE